MTDFNKNEEGFKNILLKNQIDLDTDRLWADVSDKLPRKKNRRGFVWFFLGLCTGLVLFSLGTQYLSDNSAVDEEGHLLLESISEVRNSQQEVSGRGETNGEMMFDNMDKSDHRIKTKLVENSVPGSANFNQNTASRSANYTIAYDLPNYIDQESNTKKSTLAAIMKNISDESGVDSLSNNAVNLAKATGTPLHNLVNRGLMPLKYNAELFELPGFATAVQLKDSAPAWAASVYLNAGLAMTSASYTAEGPELEPDELSENESTKTGFLTEFSYQLNHKNGIGFFAGLSYLNQVRVYRDISTEISTENFTGQGVSIDNNGQASFAEMELERTIYRKNYVQVHRFNKDLDIQIGLVFPVMRKNSFSLGTELSANYLLKRWSSGYYLEDNSKTITMFANSQTNPYKTGNQLSTQFAMVMEFQLNRYSIGLSPYYRLRMSSVLKTDSDYLLNQDNYGLSFRLGYQLF